ncbi:chaplin family protein [Haloechinothrix sp. LS1_15]|uniref:beta strand repeat-containing protein n=1 Tax=Haloechinothrix sp. LS1_15 TaxID=2652248 RepID=UPI00294B7868|nr:chaplin family protein [Haloechinothrix sp. LS1_15]
MQNWAKRGLQTALVTGGLLMLGTGIASAEENVDPDKSPASPLDGSISVPIKAENNAIGTPFGQYDTPEIDQEISTESLGGGLDGGLGGDATQARAEDAKSDAATDAVGEATGGAGLPAQQATEPVSQVTEPVQDAVDQVVGQAGQAGAPAAEDTVQQRCEHAAGERCDHETRDTGGLLGSDGDALGGNQIVGDLVIPIQISNNALGLLGDAHVSGGDSQQSVDNSREINTSGSGDTLGGNVIDLQWAVPIQIANNAGSIGGNASSSGNNAEQDTTTGGDVTTDGDDGVLAGNVLAGHWATPLQFNNNAATWGGQADSFGNASSSEADSGGSIATDGEDGVLSGNVGASPLAKAVGVNNSAASWIGIADSQGQDNTVDATAGGTRPGINDIDTYVQTNGDGGVLSGNLVEPEVAGNDNVHGVAATWIGKATAGSVYPNFHEANTKAGAFSHTSGDDSVGSGNFADAPVALPIEVFGVAGSWIGDAEADADNITTADAGSGTYTSGVDSVLGGNSAHAPVTGPVEAFGIGGTWIGTADGHATSDKLVEAGGYNGTRGDDAIGGGNLVQAPAAAPVEVFGIGGAWGGSGSGTGEETKLVSAGGDASTIDDDAVASSNLVAAPVALPAQVFGIGGAWIGNGHGKATSDTDTSAGGNYEASGENSVLSANIVQGAVAQPAQVFGIGGVWGGNASGDAVNTSTTAAGGDTWTTAPNSQGSGNIVDAASSIPVQVHGTGASWIGNASGTSDSVTDSFAGGTSTTDGTNSSLGGNVVQAPFAGSGGVFGNAASWIGTAEGDGMNDIFTVAGGDTHTAGDGGSLAGNVVSAQGLPIAQVFGNAASLTATATGNGVNFTDATSGGDITTSGNEGSMSGNIFDLPVAAVAQVFGNAATLGGVAHGTGDNTTFGTVGGMTTTSGDQGSLSGTDNQFPLGALVQVFNFELPLFGEAVALGTNATDINVAGDLPQIDMILDGAEMGATDLPALDGARDLDGARTGEPTGADVPMPLQDPTALVAGEVSPLLQPQAVEGVPAPERSEVPAAPGLPQDAELVDLDLGNISELEALFQQVGAGAAQHPVHVEN